MNVLFNRLFLVLTFVMSFCCGLCAMEAVGHEVATSRSLAKQCTCQFVDFLQSEDGSACLREFCDDDSYEMIRAVFVDWLIPHVDDSLVHEVLTTDPMIFRDSSVVVLLSQTCVASLLTVDLDILIKLREVRTFNPAELLVFLLWFSQNTVLAKKLSSLLGGRSSTP